jgi:glutamate racemase
MSADAPPSAAAAGPRIGVFDSGVGGLSVLRALHRHLPRATLLYAADSGHAPYGERDAAYVIARSRTMAAHLLSQGAQLLVVACNTATAAAIDTLRADHPALPIVGVEPGIKPAIALTRNRRIGVMATHATLASERFQRLVATYADGASLHLQACSGLARAIEWGRPDGAEVIRLVDEHAAPLRAAGVDTVVLGCTHYPFAAAPIAAALGPEVTLVDTADAVARQALRRAAGLSAPGVEATARLWTSGDPDHLRAVAQRWLHFETTVDRLPT